MYCGKCGNFLANKSALFCGRCGNYVPYASWDVTKKAINNNVIISDGSKDNKAKKMKRQKWFSITAVASIVLVVIVGIIMALGRGASGSSSVVDSFVGGNIGGGNSSGTGGDGTPEVIQMKLRESAEPEKAEVVIEFCDSVVQFSEDEAKQVNNKVVNYQMQETGLVINVTNDSPLVEIPKGNVFFIPAGGGAAFPTGYIGKVVSTTQVNGLTQILVEDPPLDEAFDYLNIDFEQYMTYDHVTSISALPGVTIKENVDDEEFTQLSSGSQNEATFLGKKGELETSDYEDGDGKLAFGFELDLLEYLGIKQNKKENINEVFDSTEASTRTVIITEAKTSYHISGCECLKTAKEANKVSLLEAITEEYLPCELCNPPIVNNKKEYLKKNLKLTGSIGIYDLRIDTEFEWIKEKGKIETLYINATGKAGARVGIEGGMNLSIGGKDTKLTALNTIEMVGLKEKMLPIAFYNFTTMTPAVGKTGINKTVGTVPLSVGVLFYIDLSGKVSADTKMTLGFEMPISYTNRMFENGEMVNDSDFDLGKFEKVAEFKVEGSAKFDIHAGLSLPVYVFNLNIMEFIAFRTGFEASGKMGVCYKSVNDEVMENDSYCEGDGELYLRAGELRFRLSVSVKNYLEKWWNSLWGDEKESEEDAVTFNIVDWNFESEPLLEHIFWPTTVDERDKIKQITEHTEWYEVNEIVRKYDKEGNEIERISGYSTGCEKTYSTYNEYGDVIKLEYHNYSSTGEETAASGITTYSYKYDEKDRIIEMSTSGIWGDNTFYYEYDGDKLIHEKNAYDDIRYEYNGDKLAKKTTGECIEIYDSNGKLSSISWFDHGFEDVYEYHSNGNLKKVVRYEGNQMTVEGIYNEEGLIEYSAEYLDGVVCYSVKSTYDSDGRLKKEVYDNHGQIGFHGTATYEYIFDSKGRIVEENMYWSTRGETPHLRNWTKYEYWD